MKKLITIIVASMITSVFGTTVKYSDVNLINSTNDVAVIEATSGVSIDTDVEISDLTIFNVNVLKAYAIDNNCTDEVDTLISEKYP